MAGFVLIDYGYKTIILLAHAGCEMVDNNQGA